MKWGLPGKTISDTHPAILISSGASDDYNSSISEKVLAVSPYYDFYLPRDISRDDWYFKDDAAYNGLLHSRAGQSFSSEIIDEVGISYPNLGTEVESAVQYCYSKNKRNSDGSVTQHWYLPAIDEIEEIVMSTYDNGAEYAYVRFDDFRNKFYWSSQPAYKRNYMLAQRSGAVIVRADRWGIYQIDNPNYARATSVYYENTTGNGPDDSKNYFKENSGIPLNDGNSNNIYCNQYLKGNYEDTDDSWLGTDYQYVFDSTVDVQGGEQMEGSNLQQSWEHTLLKVVESGTGKNVEAGYLHRTNDMARVRCVYKP